MKPFYFRGNAGNELPSNLVFLDTETTPITNNDRTDNVSAVHRFRLCVCISVRRNSGGWYGRRVDRFDSVASLWSFLLSRPRREEPATIIAHNWHYDGQAIGLWQRLDDGTIRLANPGAFTTSTEWHPPIRKPKSVGMAAIDNWPFLLIGQTAGGTIRLVDTMNYWPASLAKLGESFGIPKLRMPTPQDSEEKWYEYCERDATICEKVICNTIDLWRSENLGNWQPTGAKLAFSCFRHLCIRDRRHKCKGANESCGVCRRKIANHTIVIHQRGKEKRLELAAYYGGETRTFYRGHKDGPIFHVDVTGLFPYAMATSKVPVSLLRHVHDAGEANYRPDFAAHGYAAEVIVETRKRSIPVRRDGKIHYPCGRFATVLCGRELESAYQSGLVNRVNRFAEYKTENIFAEYVAYWWDKRRSAQLSGDSIADLLAKTMMNSLYGKFAQKKIRWSMLPDRRPPVQWGRWSEPYGNPVYFANWRAIAGVAFVETMQPMHGDGYSTDRYDKLYGDKLDPWESDQTFVAISAFVASAAREHARAIRNLFPPETCLSQVTDGFLITGDGYDAIKQSTFWNTGELGSLRLIDEYKWVRMLDATHYYTDKTECMSGISKINQRIGEFHYVATAADNSTRNVSRNPDRNIFWRDTEIDLTAKLGMVESNCGEWLSDETKPEELPDDWYIETRRAELQQGKMFQG